MRFLAVRLPSLNGVSRGSVAPEVEVKVLLQLEMDTVVFLEHLGHPFGKIEQNRYNGYRTRGNWSLSARTGRTAIRLADSCSVAGASFNHQSLRRIFMTQTNRQIVLAARPEGEPKTSDFNLVEGVARQPEAGEVLCRTIYLSLDPYMRGRMSAAKSYVEPVEVGEVMGAGVVGEVVDSSFDGLNPGNLVVGLGGWQEYFTAPGSSVRKLDLDRESASTALGVLGMPGMTAYVGLKNIGKPQPGETVVVAAASGAVGSVVGQIAKIQGARAVGIAGSAEKCRFVVEELGFDDCINHADPDFEEKLRQACPDGIDVYFENVGGPVFKAVLRLLNPFARVPVCGVIAHYNDTALPDGPDWTSLILRSALVKRLTIRGFLVFDYAAQEAEAIEQLSQWISQGRLKYREDFVSGLEAAPQAFIGLLKGKNFGKLVVEVSR